MNTQSQVPSDIAELIFQKRLSMHTKHEEEERQKLEKRRALIETGREKLRPVISKALTYVPKWLHQYDVTESTFDDEQLENLAQGYGNLDSLSLEFHIPGLAPIEFRRIQISGSENFAVQWRSAQAYVNWHDYGPDTPALGFNNSSYWRSDLEYTLVEAADELQAFEKKQAEFQSEKEEEKRSAQESARRQQEREASAEHERMTAQTEEQALFDVIKGDPVAVAMLKAFVFVRQERSGFESQIESANESMYSMESYWSDKAAELRRQASEAQRRADDEHYRADSIQSDLDDTEAKLKKVQRGW